MIDILPHKLEMSVAKRQTSPSAVLTFHPAILFLANVW